MVDLVNIVTVSTKSNKPTVLSPIYTPIISPFIQWPIFNTRATKIHSTKIRVYIDIDLSHEGVTAAKTVGVERALHLGHHQPVHRVTWHRDRGRDMQVLLASV